MGAHFERPTDKSVDFSKVSFLIRPVIERLVAEIGRSLDYYKNQFNVERIDKVILTGGGAHLKNLVSYLESELQLPVEHFNPLKETLFDSKKIDVPFLDQTGSAFTIATGVALSEPIRIELLPAKEPLLSRANIMKVIPIMVSLVIAIILFGIVWYMNSQVSSLQRERNEKMAKLQKLEAIKSSLVLLKEKENKMRQELSLFPSLSIVPIPYLGVLKEVNQALTENVTLTFLEIQPDTKLVRKASQPPKPQGGETQGDERMVLYFTGLAFGSDLQYLTALAQIIERLERSPLFKNVKLLSAEENKSYNRLAAEFEILCDIQSDNPYSSHLNPTTFPFIKGGQKGITKGLEGFKGEKQ